MGAFVGKGHSYIKRIPVHTRKTNTYTYLFYTLSLNTRKLHISVIIRARRHTRQKIIQQATAIPIKAFHPQPTPYRTQRPADQRPKINIIIVIFVAHNTPGLWVAINVYVTCLFHYGNFRIIFLICCAMRFRQVTRQD